MNPWDMNLSKLSSKKLLALHTDLGEVLRKRGIIHSLNNLSGDLAEFLFCQAYPSWKRQPNSHPGFDAIDKKKKIQIKGRRCIGKNKSHLLGAIRNLKDKDKPFDVLAVAIFSESYKIQYSVVERHAKDQEHTNSARFLLHEGCKETGVKDVTEKLSAVAIALLRTSKVFPDIRDKLETL